MVNISLAKKEDLDKLAQIYTEVYRVFDVGESWTPKTAYKLLEHWFNLQPDLSYVAEYDGELVGAFLVPVKPWWDGNHLFDGDIFVHPDYQSHGIGSVLLQAVLKKAVEKYDVTIWDSITFKKFDFPLSWYKKLGFEEVGEWVLISGDIAKVLKELEKKD